MEISDESKGRYDNGNTIFKTSVTRSNLCNYSDAYILAKEAITVPNTVVADAAVDNTYKKAIFKNCDPFTDSIT